MNWLIIVPFVVAFYGISPTSAGRSNRRLEDPSRENGITDPVDVFKTIHELFNEDSELSAGLGELRNALEDLISFIARLASGTATSQEGRRSYRIEPVAPGRRNLGPGSGRRGILDVGLGLVGSVVGSMFGLNRGGGHHPATPPPLVNPNTPPPMIKGLSQNSVKESDRAIGLGILGNFHFGSEINAKHQSMSHVVSNVPAAGWNAF